MNVQGTLLKVYRVQVAAMLLICFEGTFAQGGKKLRFTLDAPTYRADEAFAVADQLQVLGIDVNVKVWKKTDLRVELKNGTRTASMTDWGSAFFDPFDLAQPKLMTGGRGNFSFYSNPEVDALLKTGSASADSEIRKKAYHQAQALVLQDAPWGFGYLLPNIEVARREVRNFRPSQDNRVNLHDVSLQSGDTITVGMNTDAFISLDPGAYRGRETETVIRNMFDGLVTRTVEGTVIPELAESWEQSDTTTYVFRLRKGVRFHNGDLMTADDVVFTFKRVLDASGIAWKQSPRKDLLGPLKTVEKVDAGIVRFVLVSPFPAFLQALVHFQIVPEGYVKRVGDVGFAEKPVGTGPFQFDHGKLDTEIVLKRFDGYYGGAPKLPPVGPARVKWARFRPMPEPYNRVAALLAGNVSVIQAVPPDLVKRLERNNAVQVLRAKGTRSYQIELNNRVAPFNNVKVRRALNHAINWPAVFAQVYSGYGQRLTSCFLPSGFGYNQSLKPYVYDLKRAKALLKEAGYSVTNEE